MATTEERLDAAIGKYEELFEKLMHVADYLDGIEDCPYYRSSTPEGRAEVHKALRCPFECEGEDRERSRECWRKWVLAAPEGWWTV